MIVRCNKIKEKSFRKKIRIDVAMLREMFQQKKYYKYLQY